MTNRRKYIPLYYGYGICQLILLIGNCCYGNIIDVLELQCNRNTKYYVRIINEIEQNKIEQNEIEQNHSIKNNIIEYYNKSINYFTIKTNKEINTKLFKLMEKAAFIILDDINIKEYYVYEKRYFELFTSYVKKYYLRFNNNLFYKVERKYDLIYGNLIDNEKITLYDTLNEFIFDYESV